MRESTIGFILKQLGIHQKLKSSGSGWVMVSCPLAPVRHRSGRDDKPSLGVSVGPGVSIVKCHACGVGGTIDRLVRAVRREGLCTEEQAIAALGKVSWSKRYEPSLNEEEEREEVQPSLDPHIVEQLSQWHPYFKRRKFTKREVLEWQLGAFDDQSAVLLPCVLADGTVPYVQARLVRKKAFWWMPEGIHRAHVVGSHLLVGTEKSLVVTEGVFDAMRARRAVRQLGLLGKIGVVALFGSKPNRDTVDHLFSLVQDELIIMTDPDEAGDLCADNLEEVGRLRARQVSRVRLPRKATDPDNAGSRALRRALREREDALLKRMRAVLHVAD